MTFSTIFLSQSKTHHFILWGDMRDFPTKAKKNTRVSIISTTNRHGIEDIS